MERNEPSTHKCFSCDGTGVVIEPSGQSADEFLEEFLKEDEPSTEEIVLNLKNAFIHLPNWRGVIDPAIDRLESQAREIAALTARAEQAEKERDAAIADMKLIGSCEVCFYEEQEPKASPCRECLKDRRGLKWFKWRGQQDGEEKL